jgi:uncharacterized protein Veg
LKEKITAGGRHKTPKQASGLTDKELKSVFIIRVIRPQEKKPRHLFRYMMNEPYGRSRGAKHKKMPRRK